MLLDGLLLESKSVLVPDKLRLGLWDTMSFHACFKKTDNVRIIWVLGKAEASTVMHKLSKLLRLILAELLDGDLLLLFLDVVVLLLLGSAW